MTDDPTRDWISGMLAFQLAALGELDAATTAPDDLSQCAAWVAIDRQSNRLIRNVTTVWEASRMEAYDDMVVSHLEALKARAARASKYLDGFDTAVVREADRMTGMRLAVVGKGGAGKSVISGTLSRVLAHAGRRVLSIDMDTTPGLVYSLGMPHAHAGLPPEAVDASEGRPAQLAEGLLPMEAIERFATPGPDGMRYLGLGKVTGKKSEDLQRSVGPVLQLISNFGSGSWDVIADLEAGPRGPSQGQHLFADLLVVVVGPMWKSAFAARRLRGVAGTMPTVVVANRWHDESDYSELAPVIRIPDDPAAAAADRLGVALFDHCPHGPAVAAIRELASLMTAMCPRHSTSATDH